MTRIVTITFNPAIDRVYLANRLRLADNAVLEPLAIRPGGKGINVSRSLARLGVPSTAVAPVASDHIDSFRTEFRDRCDLLVSDALVVSPTPTRHTLTLLDHVGHTETHLREPGHALPAEVFAQIETQVLALAGPDSLIAFSGSLPPGLDPHAVSALVGRCAATRATVFVDSSGPFLHTCAARPDMTIKVNQHELASVARTRVDEPDHAAIAVRAALASRTGLITLGARGCVLVTPEAAWHAVSPQTSENPFCTVGCGDAALAGFLASLSTQGDPRHALASACAAGASAAFSREPGTLNRDEYLRVLPQTRVSEVRL